MTHRINYTNQSDVADWSTAKTIADAAQTWAGADADRVWQGIAYDPQGGTMRLSVAWSNVSAIDDRLTDMDNGIGNINSDHGTGFPLPSDVADIRPE